MTSGFCLITPKSTVALRSFQTADGISCNDVCPRTVVGTVSSSRWFNMNISCYNKILICIRCMSTNIMRISSRDAVAARRQVLRIE